MFLVLDIKLYLPFLDIGSMSKISDKMRWGILLCQYQMNAQNYFLDPTFSQAKKLSSIATPNEFNPVSKLLLS